jgi:hypothetical protein
MTASEHGSLRRYLTFVLVLVFHVALIAALMRFSKTLPLSASVSAPLELIILPSPAKPSSRLAPLKPNSFHVETKTESPPSSAITLPRTIAPAETSDSPIDWAGEAQKAAGDAASPAPEARSFSHDFPGKSDRPPKAIFDEPQEHHAGEQFRTDDGRWVVYVSDDCYQMSDPFRSANASSNGMGVQTYCKGKSKTPRGDLFDELPAYKKLHPEP